MNRPTPLVIYHAKCLDGFTAAWVANWGLSLSDGPPLEWNVDLHPGVYGEAPPDVTDREVYVVDFSYDPKTMRSMADKAKFLCIIDHHKTAIDALREFDGDNVAMYLSTTRSGAYLTWQWFFDETRQVPDIVQFVDDRDRWTFKYKETKDFNAGLFELDMNLENWNYAHHNVQALKEAGSIITRKQAKDIQDAIAAGLVWKPIGGVDVPTVNTPSNISETCHQLLVMYPDAPFSAAWWVRGDGKTVWSLRSRNGSEVDVSEVAKSFGGGGHKHAAGFTV